MSKPSTTKINKEIARLTKIKNERIVRALEARADLMLAEGPQGRQFVLVYCAEGKEYMAHGVVYTLPAKDEDGNDILREPVRIEDDDTPHVYNRYGSMQKLSDRLKEQGYPHVIKFFDEDESDDEAA